MISEDDLTRVSEMIQSAIESRVAANADDPIVEPWETALSIIEWVLEEDTASAVGVEEWLIEDCREELGIHPGGL